MPYYNFEKDFQVARKTEKQIAMKLVDLFENYEFIDFCDNSDYDIECNLNGKYTTIEIKEDFTCERTGNLGLEFECRGKPSGISVSKADYYIYKVHQPNGKITLWIVPTEVLKKLIADKRYEVIVNGGDPESNSMNYLFKFDFIRMHMTFLAVLEK